MSKRKFNYLIGVLVAVVSPLLLGLVGGYWVHMLVMVGIFGVLAVSLNLLVGYTGQLNLAHGALFGVGAYTSAILVTKLGVNFWLTVPLAAIMAVIIGFLVGLASLKLRGTYFTITTFAFFQLLYTVFTNARSLTEGVHGLSPIPQASIAGLVLTRDYKLIWVYIVFALLLLTIFVVDKLVHSRVGRAFIAIREDEDLAKSTGINAFWYKMLAFGIATFFAGMAGAMYSTYQGGIAPSDFNLVVVAMIIASCVLGGLSTLIGPVIGTVVVMFLPELLRGLGIYFYLIFSALIILCITYWPKGIQGFITSVAIKVKRKGNT